MYEFVQFPKLLTQYKYTRDPLLKAQCDELIRIYEMNPKNAVELGFDAPYNLESLQAYHGEVNKLLGDSLEIKQDYVMEMTAKFFVALEFDELKKVLNKILLVSNDVYILCWICIAQIYQDWFESPKSGSFNKHAYRKIQNYKLKGTNVTPELSELFLVIELLYYFDNIKQMKLESYYEGDLEIMEKWGLKDEYYVICLVHQLLDKPFNQVQIDDDSSDILALLSPGLVQLSESLKHMKLIDMTTLEPELSRILYVLPSGKNGSFLSHFSKTLKLKWFLSLMSFTSKISASHINRMLGPAATPEDTNSFILLIATLGLNDIGVGYDVVGDFFYNDNTEKNTLEYDVEKLDHLLKAQACVLMVKNELVNSVLE